MSYMRMTTWIGLAAVAVLGAIATAQGDSAADGRTLYVDNCSICHGLVAGASSSSRRPALASTFAPPVTLSDAASGQAPSPLLTSADEVAVKDQRLAIAPPYGPPLKGVFGREAGTVAGFLYSRSFRETMRGVVWHRETLDRWITDSQAWVENSIMFYKQPDPEVRRKIVDYLEANPR